MAVTNEPDETVPIVHPVATNTAIVFATTFVGLGLNYLLGICIARWIGAEQFGVYAIGLYVFIVIVTISVAGLDSAVLRFVPGAVVARASNRVREIIRGAVTLGLLTSSIITIVFLAHSDQIALQFYKDSRLISVFRGFALAIPVHVTLTILISVLQAHHDAKWRMLVKYIAEPFIRFGITGILIFAGLQLNGVVAGYISAVWLSTLFIVVIIRRFNIAIFDRKAQPPWKELISYVGPLFFGLIFAVVASRSDVLLLGKFVGAAEVGIYAASFQTAAMLSIILQSIESVLAPVFSEKIAIGDRKLLTDVYKSALRWVLYLGVPLFVSLIVFAEELLGLYGPEFVVGAQVFCLLTAAQFINLATGSANYILILSGNSKLIMINGMINAVTFIGSNTILIPTYGILGAAIAVLFSLSTLNVLRVIEVYVLYGIHPYSLNQLKPIMAGLAIAIVYTLAVEQIVEPNRLILFPFIIISYVICVVVTGFESEDRNAIRSLLIRLRSIRIR